MVKQKTLKMYGFLSKDSNPALFKKRLKIQLGGYKNPPIDGAILN
jgi:hypothetical protein